MQFLSRIAYFLIHTDLVISISGGVLTYGIARHFSLEYSTAYAVIVALLTFSVYRLQRIADHTDLFKTECLSGSRKVIFPVVVLSFIFLIVAIIAGICCFHYHPVLIFLTLIFSFVCYWYAIPVFGRKLREIPGIKIVATALTWVYACTFFPLMNEGVSFTRAGLLAGLLFLYFIAIILPFDIRDVHTDSYRQSTVPQAIGIFPAKLLGVVLLSMFFAGSLSFEFISPVNWLFYGAVITQVILLLLVNEHKTPLYFGLIDALIVLLGISYLI